MATVFLVMAVASVHQHRQPIPLRVFNERAQAEDWLSSVIDYHSSPPELPFVEINDAASNNYHAQVGAWRVGHPAGIAASHYEYFGVYDVPLGL